MFYRIEERRAGTTEWKPLTLYSPFKTMREAVHYCREVHDSWSHNDHRVVDVTRDVKFLVQVTAASEEVDGAARRLRRDLTGVQVADSWASMSERDLHVQAVLNFKGGSRE
jgi:hypothetical protein